MSFWYPCREPLVLASRSPRRHDILRNAGIPHTVHPPEVDEDNTAGDPSALVTRHAALKAASVAPLFPDRPVLGADTIVFMDGATMGKPASGQEAADMLGRLSGRWHDVWGGVSIVWDAKGIEITFSERTSVLFRELDRLEIEAYVGSGEPLDKAGAYGIQELGSLLVSRVEGCYFNVMGLPVARAMMLFREALGASPGKPGAGA